MTINAKTIIRLLEVGSAGGGIAGSVAVGRGVRVGWLAWAMA